MRTTELGPVSEEDEEAQDVEQSSAVLGYPPAFPFTQRAGCHRPKPDSEDHYLLDVGIST